MLLTELCRIRVQCLKECSALFQALVEPSHLRSKDLTCSPVRTCWGRCDHPPRTRACTAWDTGTLRVVCRHRHASCSPCCRRTQPHTLSSNLNFTTFVNTSVTSKLRSLLHTSVTSKLRSLLHTSVTSKLRSLLHTSVTSKLRSLLHTSVTSKLRSLLHTSVTSKLRSLLHTSVTK